MGAALRGFAPLALLLLVAVAPAQTLSGPMEERQLERRLDQGEGVRWPHLKKCFPTTATVTLFDQLYTSDSRERYAQVLMEKSNPPKNVTGNYSFAESNDGFKCKAKLSSLQVGPITNLSLPSRVDIADIRNFAPLLNGDGQKVSASKLRMEVEGQARLSVKCSISAFKSPWVQYCSMHGQVNITTGGWMRVDGNVCLDASLQNIQTCIDKVQSCMYATCTKASADVQDLTLKVHDLTGSDLCSLVGLGEDYVNELLNSEDAEFRRMLNQELENSLLTDVNEALAAAGIRPYKQHPL